MQIFINQQEATKTTLLIHVDALQKLSNYDYMLFSFERQELNTKWFVLTG